MSKVQALPADAELAGRGASRPLSARIFAALSGEILAGAIAPGTRLDEEDLCARFAASRTPVREAVLQLAARGMVEIRPRQGVFVIRLGVEALAEMFETMAYLEAACAALAARRHTVSDREALQAAHEGCIDAANKADPGAFYEANTRFHECIYRAGHNQHLATLTLELRNRLEAYRRETTFHPGLMQISLREHAAVMALILSMDEDAAATSMRKHLDTLRNDAVSMAAMLSSIARAMP